MYLADGYSWASSVGGVWTASATSFTVLPIPEPIPGVSVLYHYVLSSPRYLLADAIEAKLATIPVAGDITVYPYLPDNLAAPAIVIGTDDPEQSPASVGGPGTVAWAFLVTIEIVPTKTEEAQNTAERYAAMVRLAILDEPNGFRWVETSAPERHEVAGREYLRKVVGVGYIQDDPLTGG